jgi:catalase
LNTYKFTKKDGSFRYVKIHMKSCAGVKIFFRKEATKFAGEDPDYHCRVLSDTIAKGDLPQWDVYAQIIPLREAETYKINIFDPTKAIQKYYPLVPFGKITLKENPTNFFSVNFIQSAVNKPKYSYKPTKRDGAGNIDNLGSLPNDIPATKRSKRSSPPISTAKRSTSTGRGP